MSLKPKWMASTLLLVSICWPSSSSAQETQDAFSLFDRYCLSGDLDAIHTKSFAERQHWRELGSEVVETLSPFANAAIASGWVIGEGDGPLRVLVVSRREKGADIVEGCTVGLYKTDTVGFESKITKRLGFEAQSEESSSQRHYKRWLTREPERLVTISTPLDGSKPGEIVASVVRSPPRD